MSARIDEVLRVNDVSAAQYLKDWGHKCSPEERTYLQTLVAPDVQEPEVVKATEQEPEKIVKTAPLKLPIPTVDVEDEPEEKTGRYSKYVLYDANNPEHREMMIRRKEWGGLYFLRGDVASENEAGIDAHYLKHGRLPIGVVKHGDGIGAAYFPVENSTDLTDIRWLQQARAFRDYADYEDAVYAEWPDLMPCAGELKPTPTFNPDWLPDAVKPFVNDVSERMAVAVDLSAVCALTCLAGAISHRAFVFPLAMDKDFAEPLNISGAVIADSGKKKTPTWKILMNPLIEWERDQDHVYEQRMAGYMKKLQEYQTAKKAVDDYNKEEKKQAKKAGRDPDFKSCEITQHKEPEKPHRLVVNDSTPEEIHEIAKTNPQGLFYYRDELSGWAAELDMTGREGARSMFLQGMTGDHHHTVDRIGRDGGHALVTLSVFGSFQPHLFINFFSETRNVADGTIPRLQFLVWPDDRRLPALDRQVNMVAKAQYRQVVRRLADLPDKSVEIHLSKDAQQLYYTFQKELADKIRRESNSGKRSHLSKYEGGLAKIAGLLQLVDHVAALPETPRISMVSLETGETKTVPVLEEPKQVHIDLEHFQRAQNLLEYLEAHMHRVYDSKLEGIEYRKVRLVEHLKDGSIHDGMSARDINQKDWAGLSRKVASADSIEAALEELVHLGWVRPIPVKPGTARPGRPTVRWEVNPEARRVGRGEE